MRKPRFAGIVIVFAVVSALLYGPPASAGTVDAVYPESTKTLRSGERVSVTVMCPKGRPVLSGGTYITGTDISIEMASNGPVDGRDRDRVPDDGWRGSGNNDSGTSRYITVRAQCGPRSMRSILAYRTEKETAIPHNSNGSHTDCPDGYDVIGGGAHSSGTSRNVVMVTTTPDEIANPDAWSTLVRNGSTRNVRVTTTAICADLPAPPTHVDGPVTTVAPGTQASASATCPFGGHAYGGGSYRTNSTGLTLATVFPQQVDPGQSRGWDVWVNNVADYPQTFQATTICA